MIHLLPPAAVRDQIAAIARCQTLAALQGLRWYWLCHGVLVTPAVRDRIEAAIAEAADAVEAVR